MSADGCRMSDNLLPEKNNINKNKYVNARKYNGLIRSALAKATEGDHKTNDPTKHYLVRDVSRDPLRLSQTVSSEKIDLCSSVTAV